MTVDLEPSASKDEIKAKLEAATGVPQEHQKLLLSGINQIVMGDKRWGGLRDWGVMARSRRLGSGSTPAISCETKPQQRITVPLSITCRTNIGFSACGSANGVQMAVNSK